MNDILNLPYSFIFVKNEDDSYSGEIAEFPGCFAQGDSLVETMENLVNVADSWIEAAIEQGLPIPEPAAAQEFSGRVALRLPKSLHKKAVEQAALDGISLNQFLVDAVAEKVGAVNLYHYLKEQLSAEIVANTHALVLKTFEFPKKETPNTYTEIFSNVFTWNNAKTTDKELIHA